MKMTVRAIGIFAALLVGGVAGAQVKPLRADGGLVTTTQTSWQGSTGVPGLYYKLSSGWWARNPDNSETGPFGGVTWPLTNGTSTNTYTSAVANSGTAHGHIFDETNGCATDGCMAYEFRSGGNNWLTIGRAAGAHKFTLLGDADGTGAGPMVVQSSSSSAGITLDATAAGGRKYSLSSAALGIMVFTDLTAGLNRWAMDANGALYPYAHNTTNLGLPGTNEPANIYSVLGTFSGAVTAKWSSTVAGSALTSASTITPTASMHHVTGTVTITTIATTNLPASFNGELLLICDAACVFATGGNISTGVTGTANKGYAFWWDGTAWRLQGDQDALTGSLTTGRFTLSNGTRAVTDSSSFTFSGTTATMTNMTVGSLLKAQRLANQSSTPAIAVGAGAQLGTSPSSTIAGGDIGGSVTLTTGTGPSAFSASTAVTEGTITFNTTFSAAPKAGVMYPCNTAAAALATGTNGVTAYMDRSTFSTTTVAVKLVSAGTPTLAASTAYEWCYVVVQ